MADDLIDTRFPKRHSLAAQMMLSLSALAVLTALVVGVPAIWLVRNQLQNQAWSQVQQGLQASRALYDAQQAELAGLATLTAERPSLAALLRQPEGDALLSYLDILRAGAGLDLIVACDPNDAVVAQVAAAPSAALLPPLCAMPPGVRVLTTQPSGVTPQVWLTAAQPVTAGDAGTPGKVVVGRWLGDAFARAMRSQTGLDHTLLVGDLPVATSLSGDAFQMRPADVVGDGRTTFTWDGQPFYAARFALPAPAGEPPVQLEADLSTADVIATQQRLLRLLLGSMALAAAIGLLLAVVLARRISRPLADLTNAAATMRGGDLSRPIAFDSSVREVALVGQALEGARGDLQRTLAELRREKALTDHFLANVSHEFRTPLTAVAASVELLLDQAADLSPAELQELLTTLHLGVLNLHKLVDNLLESASIEAGRFRVHPRPASLGEIIAEATATMQPLLDRHGQRLVVELPAAIPVVMADSRRTVQVLVNLLSNASNAQRGLFDTTHGQITISAAVEGGAVRVMVADRGPGIPPEQRAELLRGRRFDPVSTGQESAPAGFGLGLSVVKAIVEGHGGILGMDDQPGGGAVVWFTLPRA